MKKPSFETVLKIVNYIEAFVIFVTFLCAIYLSAKEHGLIGRLIFPSGFGILLGLVIHDHFISGGPAKAHFEGFKKGFEVGSKGLFNEMKKKGLIKGWEMDEWHKDDDLPPKND